MKAQYQNRFFSRIRNYFDAKYNGRYFGIILAELARSEPDAFAAIIQKAGIKLPKQHMKSLSAGELTIDLEWSSAAIDHIVPHIKGGRTELSNGRYAARSCNIARGIREDFDPATECFTLRQTD